MFLHCTPRKKNGREHRSWSIVESKRCAGNKIVQRHVLYLGEINDQQEANWQKTIDLYEHGQAQPRTVALFPEDRVVADDAQLVRIKLSELQLRRPRPWGACWLFCQLYEELGLRQFWADHLPPSRKGTARILRASRRFPKRTKESSVTAATNARTACKWSSP